MATTIGTTVIIKPDDPSIQITSNVSGGQYPPTVYIRKSSISTVTGTKSKKDVNIDGSFNGYKWEVNINMIDGSSEKLDLSEVQNKPTWTVDDTGLLVAINEIAQTA